jgi:hypothetical protein
VWVQSTVAHADGVPRCLGCCLFDRALPVMNPDDTARHHLLPSDPRRGETAAVNEAADTEGEHSATATHQRQSAGTADATKAVDVMVAEFNALRAEIVARTNSQAALVGVGLTALGVIVGFVVKDKANERLLLALPPLAALVNLLWSIENRRVTLIGAYIREALWPRLQRYTGIDASWEKDVHNAARPHGRPSSP